MYGFLLKPKWIVSHVAVAALLVAMVAAMFWQIGRMHEKQDLNAIITERAESGTKDFSTVAADNDLADSKVQDGLEFQAVRLSGTFDVDHEFTIPNRTLDGAPGRLIVTPLVWSDSEAPMLVLRGFIPQSFDDNTPPIDGVEPPSGEVQVAGYLRLSETPGSLQVANPDVGDNQMARMDIERLQETFGREFQPMWLLSANQEPPTDQPLLSTYPLPERSEGRHFSYAVQWGIFTLIAAVGYVLVLRRAVRTNAGLTKQLVPSEVDSDPAGASTDASSSAT